MNFLTDNNFAVRIPEAPSRYRANCGKDWGLFVTGDTKGMNTLKAEKAGLTKGNFVEMAICWMGQRTLTFEPHYFNEEFSEIWGIPVSGEMKSQFSANASELSTFLIHRQSKDKFSGLTENCKRDGFSAWVEAGMQGDIDNLTSEKIAEFYFNNIFRFEFVVANSSTYGAYHYVGITTRPPESDLEKSALIIAKQLYQAQLDGFNYCTDPRLVENEQKCLSGSTSTAPLSEAKQIQQEATKKRLATAK